jgi:serine/threonine protein kinase
MKGYKLGQLINNGSYASVYILIRESDQRKFALKIFTSRINTRKKESMIMDVLGIYNEPTKVSKRHAIIMDLYGTEDLYDVYSNHTFRSVSHERRVETLYNMVTQVERVNSMRIIHADVKLENFVVECRFPLKLRLVDFGLSEMIPDGDDYVKLNTYKGTVEYLAPEVAVRRLYHNSDVFSLGVLAIQMWTDSVLYRNDYIFNNYIDCVDSLRYVLPIDVYDFISSTVTDHISRSSCADLKNMKLFDCISV